MTRQETINKAVTWALATAEDPSHGYDQAYRWGPNYDCSSFVISAWEAAGVPVRSSGASYTGNMRAVFLRCGFADVTGKINLATGSGLEKGDVLLRHDYSNDNGHTELFIGGGKVVKASINEFGGVTGGQSGDQNGREIYVGGYYNSPWNCVLRYATGDDGDDPEPEPTPDPVQKGDYSLELHVLKRGAGMTGQESLREEVRAVQQLLVAKGFGVGSWGCDGEFGGDTENAVKQYQTDKKLTVDGEVGQQTMRSLHGLT